MFKKGDYVRRTRGFTNWEAHGFDMNKCYKIHSVRGLDIFFEQKPRTHFYALFFEKKDNFEQYIQKIKDYK